MALSLMLHYIHLLAVNESACCLNFERVNLPAVVEEDTTQVWAGTPFHVPESQNKLQPELMTHKLHFITENISRPVCVCMFKLSRLSRPGRLHI